MPGIVVPALTVQQRLFVDRWWGNGGNLIEAVEFANYAGYYAPSEKAKKGRQLLANKSIKAYVVYLREKEAAERKARMFEDAKIKARAEAIAAKEMEAWVKASTDQKTVERGAAPTLQAEPSNPDGQADGDSSGLQVDLLSDPACGSPNSTHDATEGASHPANAPSNSCDLSPGPDRSVALVDLGSRAAGTLAPPIVGIEQSPYGKELCQQEVRELLANIARGNERSMSDARTRMRAIELAMRNMGMLVDMQMTATATIGQGQDVKAMSAEERNAEMQKLETYFATIKDATKPKAKLEAKPAEPSE